MAPFFIQIEGLWANMGVSPADGRHRENPAIWMNFQREIREH
jgi:hypothetical protein